MCSCRNSGALADACLGLRSVVSCLLTSQWILAFNFEELC